ncbi:hypothetical protein ElyMa_006467800, partial [Elysia marginata]
DRTSTTTYQLTRDTAKRFDIDLMTPHDSAKTDDQAEAGTSAGGTLQSDDLPESDTNWTINDQQQQNRVQKSSLTTPALAQSHPSDQDHYT